MCCFYYYCFSQQKLRMILVSENTSQKQFPFLFLFLTGKGDPTVGVMNGGIIDD